MPLYIHTATGERVRTAPGRYEDARLAASPDWQRVPAAAQSGDEPSPDGAEETAPPRKRQPRRRG